MHFVKDTKLQTGGQVSVNKMENSYNNETVEENQPNSPI